MDVKIRIFDMNPSNQKELVEAIEKIGASYSWSELSQEEVDNISQEVHRRDIAEDKARQNV